MTRPLLHRFLGWRQVPRLSAWLVSAALIACVAVPPAAQAAHFGPDLTTATPASAGPACYWLGGPNGGCTLYDPYTTFALNWLPDPLNYGDQTGVVTQLHVVAPASETVQFSVVEWSSKVVAPEPFPSGVSAITGQLNLHAGLNNFNTNLPVDARLTRDGYEVWSSVSMSILSSSAPTPIATDLSKPFANIGVLVDNFGPITSTSADLTVPPHSTSVGGWKGTLMMSGEVTVTTPPAPAPTPTPQPQPRPATPTLKLTFPSTARVGGNTATVPLRCAGTARCSGTVRIRNRAATAAAAKLTTYASGSFSIAAGAKQQVKAKLTAAGKRALRGHRSLKAYAVATFSNGTVSTSRITLQR